MGELAGMDTTTILLMVALFASSMGEAFFPDMLKMSGLKQTANVMFVADCLGNMCGALAPTSVPWKADYFRTAAVPAIIDMVSKAFILSGQAICGGPTKSVVYNSCIVFSALISKAILKKVLTPKQWAGVAVVVTGCVLKGLADYWLQHQGSKPKPTTEDDSAADTQGDSFFILFIGFGCLLVGCALHSLANVVNEYYIKESGIPPPKLCCCIGITSFSVWSLAGLIGFNLPEYSDNKWIMSRDELEWGQWFSMAGEAWRAQEYTIHEELAASSGQTKVLWFSPFVAWFWFVVCSGVHAIAFFLLLGSVGNVSLGVMKGATTAGYVSLAWFLLSGFYFKAIVKWPTFCAVLVCVAGVGIYTWASFEAAKEKQAREAEESSQVEGQTSDTTVTGQISSMNGMETELMDKSGGVV